ncbi:DUF6880 family protein, partial [Rhizobium ruizarguesonis]
LYEHETDGTQRDRTVRIALQEMADAQGDVDAYIAQQSEKTRKMPMISADIANRLVSSGRPKEALEVLKEVETTSQAD